MQENNIFYIRRNRFNNPKLSEKNFSYIQLQKSFKSIHLSKELFTNYSSSMAAKKYTIVKNVWKKYQEKSNIIDLYMNADELINENKKIERLKRIIEKNIDKSLTNNEIIHNIYKFKHKEDKEIQFYFYYNGKILDLVLIDLFHLGITASKNSRDLSESNYLSNKKNRVCLSHIVKFS